MDKKYIEDQYSVSDWSIATFGSAGSNRNVLKKAEEEFDELIKAIEANDTNPLAAVEIADVMIVLLRLATRLGVDIYTEIDKKMAINRTRKWDLKTNRHIE